MSAAHASPVFPPYSTWIESEQKCDMTPSQSRRRATCVLHPFSLNLFRHICTCLPESAQELAAEHAVQVSVKLGATSNNIYSVHVPLRLDAGPAIKSVQCRGKGKGRGDQIWMDQELKSKIAFPMGGGLWDRVMCSSSSAEVLEATGELTNHVEGGPGVDPLAAAWRLTAVGGRSPTLFGGSVGPSNIEQLLPEDHEHDDHEFNRGALFFHDQNNSDIFWMKQRQVAVEIKNTAPA
ncbi:hypothetical protein ZIOFF_070228 [Zingiber officinale]|uniref:Uncharacterized protein n=1 Tax=Zingiber officinale TaxID=94328 RepID=A0A8J5CWK2_ZINOF|nr:hypothetical protein ZIOFF_070228 [Zingiber officinale]